MTIDHPSRTCPGCAGLATVTERTQNLTGWQSKQNGQLGELVKAIEKIDDKLEHYTSIAEVRMTATEKAVAVIESQHNNGRWSIQMILMALAILVSLGLGVTGFFVR